MYLFPHQIIFKKVKIPLMINMLFSPTVMFTFEQIINSLHHFKGNIFLMPISLERPLPSKIQFLFPSFKTCNERDVKMIF